jgi:hypothetical protein
MAMWTLGSVSAFVGEWEGLGRVTSLWVEISDVHREILPRLPFLILDNEDSFL